MYTYIYIYAHSAGYLTKFGTPRSWHENPLAQDLAKAMSVQCASWLLMCAVVPTYHGYNMVTW